MKQKQNNTMFSKIEKQEQNKNKKHAKRTQPNLYNM
jgi:hypothetical protein